MNQITLIGAGLMGLGSGLLTALLFPWLTWAWPLVALLVAAMLWRRAGTGALRLSLALVSFTWALSALNFGPARLNVPEVGGVNVTESSRPLSTLSATGEQLKAWQSARRFHIVNALGTVSIEGGAALGIDIHYRTTRRRARAPDTLRADFDEQTGTLSLIGIDPEASERERRGLSADIVLSVPTDATVSVMTDVGDIEVAALGQATLITGVGDVSAEAIGGDLRATSEVGDIRVHDSRAEIDVRTGVGAATLSFEQPVQASVRARANVGDITLSLPKTSSVALRALSEMQSFSGELERLTPTEARLLLGDESAEVLLQTGVGEIDVTTY